VEEGLDRLSVVIGDGPSLDGVGIPRRVTKRRGRAEEWEIPLLAMLSEHGAVGIDQLAGLSERDVAEVEEIVASLEERGLVFGEVVLPEEPAWVWCTARGSRLSGTGLWPFKLRLGALDRLRAVNEVHLSLRRNCGDVRWFSERVLLREGNPRKGLPRAVAVIDGDAYAIEVVLKDSGRAAAERRLRQLSGGCEHVLCYSSERLGRRTREAIRKSRLINVAWDELPSA
jgi:hypothetical protein